MVRAWFQEASTSWAQLWLNQIDFSTFACGLELYFSENQHNREWCCKHVREKALIYGVLRANLKVENVNASVADFSIEGSLFDFE